jgi:cytochrome P450
MLEQVGVAAGPLHAGRRRRLTNRNGLPHTLLRGLVSRAFLPRRAMRLRPRITEHVRGILARHAESGRLDVVHDPTDPLPIWRMCALLGIREEEHGTFARRSTASFARTQPTDFASRSNGLSDPREHRSPPIRARPGQTGVSG